MKAMRVRAFGSGARCGSTRWRRRRQPLASPPLYPRLAKNSRNLSARGAARQSKPVASAARSISSSVQPPSSAR